uniref:Alkyl transferase n=1 Tax=Xenopsylla cheopis TaxID=163159 RepID=A0A6M2DRW8_XENCH
MSWICEKSLSWLQLFSIKIIKCGPIPKHIAFIMDGNRRFATKNNTQKSVGHSKGFDKLSETLQWCLEIGVTEVTVYAFSIENFKRCKDEVETLMNLAREKFQRLLNEEELLREKGVHIRVIGNLNLLPDDLKRLIAKSMLITKDNNKVYLNVAFAYTSQEEITNAVLNIVKAAENNVITPDCINEQLISECLYTDQSSDPDLLIRTSGEHRLSDFLLWQIAPSCIYFTDVLWPEFRFWNFLSSILYYQRCYDTIENIKMKQNHYLIENCPIKSKQVEIFLKQIKTARQNQLQLFADLL